MAFFCESQDLTCGKDAAWMEKARENTTLMDMGSIEVISYTCSLIMKEEYNSGPNKLAEYLRREK
jgi:hypothetical protein